MTYENLLKNVGSEGWANFLKPFMCPDDQGKCAFDETAARMRDAYKDPNKIVYPAIQNVFRAFREVPIEKVRIVLLGQDPYPKKNIANGLAFAVEPGTPIPQSLDAIYKAIQKDAYQGNDTQFTKRDGRLGRPNDTGEMNTWMEQGVLPLNTALTVEDSNPGSHSEWWAPLIQFIIDNIWRIKRNIIFMGWGGDARDMLEWKKLSDQSDDMLGQHKGANTFASFVLTHEHPSAAGRDKRPWLCDHFSRVNLIITCNNLGTPIQW